MNRSIICILGLIVCVSCYNLDSNLFNPNADIERYQLDEFEGDQEFELPENEYSIEADMVHRLEIPFDQHGIPVIHAIYIGDMNELGRDSVILYLHGNSGNIDFYWNRTKLLTYVGSKHRYGVLVIDYPGFGLTQGTPTIENLILSANAAGQWLKDRGLSPGQLFLYGFSLGSIPSLQSEYLLEPMNGSIGLTNKVMLEAPIGSIQTMVDDGSALSFDASFFTSYHDNSNIEASRKLQQPLLILHGNKDDYLNSKTHGIPIKEAYEGLRLIFKEVEGASHGDLPQVMGFENYLREIESFMIE